MSDKIKIGISSCLLGNNVRFDGGNKLDQGLIDAFGPLVEWVPICPEVESGMTIPREPMQLVRIETKQRLITRESRLDRTGQISCWLERKLRQLQQTGIKGFVLKARSPSCGVRDTPLYSIAGENTNSTAGLFAAAVIKRFPLLPIEDEETLRDPDTRERFLSRVLP